MKLERAKKSNVKTKVKGRKENPRAEKSRRNEQKLKGQKLQKAKKPKTKSKIVETRSRRDEREETKNRLVSNDGKRPNT